MTKGLVLPFGHFHPNPTAAKVAAVILASVSCAHDTSKFELNGQRYAADLVSISTAGAACATVRSS